MISKSFLVINAENFVKFCEKKLDTDITADDFILLESFKDEHINLVTPSSSVLDICRGISKFDIYIKIRNSWIKRNIVDIYYSDILELLDDDTIMDANEYINWKDKLAFEITDINRFMKDYFKRFKDSEAIQLFKTLHNRPGDKNIYLVADDKGLYSVLVNDIRTMELNELPLTKLTELDILYLIKNDLAKNVKCKVNKYRTDIIVNDKLIHIRPTFRYLKLPNKRYNSKNKCIFEVSYLDKFHKYRTVATCDENEKIALENLRQKLEKVFGHECNDMEKTTELYKNVIVDNKEI